MTDFGPAQLHPGMTPLEVMMAFLGVQERGGANRGPWIDETLRFCGLDPEGLDAPPGGYPWCCSSFVWCAHKGGVALPRTPRVAELWGLVQDRRIERFEVGCGIVHLKPGGRRGHVLYGVRDNRDGTFLTVSGNTNGSGSSEGNRVGLVVHDARYVFENGGGFFHMRPQRDRGGVRLVS